MLQVVFKYIAAFIITMVVRELIYKVFNFDYKVHRDGIIFKKLLIDFFSFFFIFLFTVLLLTLLFGI